MPDMEQVYEILKDYETRLRYLEAIDPGAGGGLKDHDHTAVVGDGGVLTGDEHDLWGEYLEIVKPAAPAANKIRFYASDLGGVTRLYTTDSAGLQTLLAGGGMGDVDTVDTIHAGAAPAANSLLALGAASIFPADVVDWGTLTLDAQVFADSWNNVVAWVLPGAHVNWQTDTQTTNVTPRRTSTVIAIAHVTWQDSTAGRTSFMNFRWDLNGVAGTTQGPLGCQFSRREGHPILGIWTGVTAGAKALTLEAQKTVPAWQADTIIVASRFAIVFMLPED